MKKYSRENNNNDNDTVEMTKANLLKEHKRLIKILRTGTLSERLAEAKLQEKEMQEYL